MSGPSGRETLFVDKLKFWRHYKPLILKHNYHCNVNKRPSSTRWTILYGKTKTKELRPDSNTRVKTEHVLIPADYESGITLVMLDSNENVRELLECPELQLFSSSDATAAAASSSSSN